MPVKSFAVTRCLALAIAAIALTAPQALAHGGGLDSHGCHTNNKTGDRHCHRSGGSTPKPSSGLASGPVKLVSVGDGDTVRVSSRKGGKVTVRLACIDALNLAGASGRWSTETLKGFIQGKSISLKPQVKDRYGRTVAEIYVGNRTSTSKWFRSVLPTSIGNTYSNGSGRHLRAEDAATKKGLGSKALQTSPGALGIPPFTASLRCGTSSSQRISFTYSLLNPKSLKEVRKLSWRIEITLSNSVISESCRSSSTDK